MDNYYVTKKSFLQDLKLVGITIISLFTPKRMGHYLFIKLLKIEDNDKMNLFKVVDNVRVKLAKHKEINKNNRRNYRIMILMDIITILSSIIISSFVSTNFMIPGLLFNPKLNFVLGTLIINYSHLLCNLTRN